LKLEFALAGVGALMSIEPKITATVEMHRDLRTRRSLTADI
jgi:hypothetical protein